MLSHMSLLDCTTADILYRLSRTPPPMWPLLRCATGSLSSLRLALTPSRRRFVFARSTDHQHTHRLIREQLFETEMDNFFSLFRRYLNDKAKGNAV